MNFNLLPVDEDELITPSRIIQLNQLFQDQYKMKKAIKKTIVEFNLRRKDNAADLVVITKRKNNVRFDSRKKENEVDRFV